MGVGRLACLGHEFDIAGILAKAEWCACVCTVYF